jgi:hypothetical protein
MREVHAALSNDLKRNLTEMQALMSGDLTTVNDMASKLSVSYVVVPK